MFPRSFDFFGLLSVPAISSVMSLLCVRCVLSSSTFCRLEGQGTVPLGPGREMIADHVHDNGSDNEAVAVRKAIPGEGGHFTNRTFLSAARMDVLHGNAIRGQLNAK